MFRALSAHPQEDTIVYMQHMVLSLSTRVCGGLSVHSKSCAYKACLYLSGHPITAAVLRDAVKGTLCIFVP